MKKVIFSLKFKIIISIVCLILFFGTLATAFVYFRTLKTINEFKSSQLSTLTLSQTEKILQRLNTTKSVLKTIADNPEVKSHLSTPGDNSYYAVDKLLASQEIDDRFLAVYILDSSGKAIVSTDKRFIGNDYSFRNYFTQALSEGWGWDSAVGVTSNELGIYLSRVVSDDSSRPIGVAVVKMNPKTIESLIHIEENLEVDYLLTDECGVTLFSNNESFIFNSLGAYDNTAKKECRLSERFPSIEIHPLGYGIVLRDIKSGNSFSTIDFYDEIDKSDEIVSYSVIGEFPYIFLTEVEKNSFFGSVRDISAIVAIFVVAAALFALIIISLMVSAYLSPIKDLRIAIKEYSKGNFTYRANVTSKDEFADILQLLNLMAGQLQALYENMESKVSEKTAELEKLNSYMTGREMKMIDLKEKIKKLKHKKI